MASPSPTNPFLDEPTSSPLGSAQSDETKSTHASDPLPLLVQHQIRDSVHTPTTGHAFIYIPTSPPMTLPQLTITAIQALRETQNPNNSDVIPGTALIDHLVVHWGVPTAERHSPTAFPATTELSAANLDVVLSYMRRSKGYDFLEIRHSPAKPVAPATSPVEKMVRFSLNKKKKDRPDLSKGKGKDFTGQPMLDYSK